MATVGILEILVLDFILYISLDKQTKTSQLTHILNNSILTCGHLGGTVEGVVTDGRGVTCTQV